MKITENLMEYLEDLSKLKLSEKEKNEAKNELTELLNYMEHLSQVDTSSVENKRELLERNNCFREDVVTGEDRRSEILKNAPDAKGDYFRVLKAVE